MAEGILAEGEIMNLNYLVIECTRRCNMTCDHCLRGDPEDIDMSIKYVRKLFKKIDYISTLTLSGGEVSLVPDILIKIIKVAKEEGVEIGSFYMATNGKKVSDKFIRALFEWFMFCSDDNEMNAVMISRDTFHEDIDQRNIDKLKAFRFTGLRDEADNYNGGQDLISEGRAAMNFAATRYETPSEVDIYEESIDGTLLLDCNGALHTSCDISYDTMGEGEFCIGNVMDKGFNLMEAVEAYNLKLNLKAA